MEDEDALDIGVNEPADRSGKTSATVADRERSQRSDKRTGLLLALAVIGTAVAALIGIPLLTGESDSATPPTETEPDSAPSAVPERAAPPTATRVAGDDSAIAGGFEPPSRAHLSADDIALLFETKLDTDQTRYGIAYVALDNFLVLDDRGISAPQLELAQVYSTVANLALLTSGEKTWAIDGQDRDRAYLVSNSYVVVLSEVPGTLAVVRPDDPTSVGLLSSALPAPPYEVPQGAELLWAQGRGVLVLPRTGGTFAVSAAAKALTQISEDRAVAASLGATVYESCDAELQCRIIVETAANPEIDVPFAVGTSFSVSPDGESLVAWEDGPGEDQVVTLMSLVDGTETDLSGAPVTAIDWAPDSSFVALARGGWLLQVAVLATAEVEMVQMSTPIEEGALLVFEG